MGHNRPLFQTIEPDKMKERPPISTGGGELRERIYRLQLDTVGIDNRKPGLWILGDIFKIDWGFCGLN